MLPLLLVGCASLLLPLRPAAPPLPLPLVNARAHHHRRAAGAGVVMRRAAVPICMVAPTEFSRPHRVDRKQKSERIKLEATPEECAALCQRFDLDGMDELTANVSISKLSKAAALRVRATGSFAGLGVLRKNFGGEQVTMDVRGPEFEAFFATEPEEEERGASSQLVLDDDEAFDEPIVDGEIDLGELVAQHFYMHLCELTLQEASEWNDPKSVIGEVYYDTDPSEPDTDGGGTLGERLGF